MFISGQQNTLTSACTIVQFFTVSINDGGQARREFGSVSSVMLSINKYLAYVLWYWLLVIMATWLTEECVDILFLRTVDYVELK